MSLRIAMSLKMKKIFKQDPYIPGKGKKPKLLHSKRSLTAKNFKSHSDFHLGIKLHNKGYYWEAHEVWESIWRKSKQPQKDFLKALIQFSAAHLKVKQGDAATAHRLVLRVRVILKKLSNDLQSPNSK
jgi:predicted metal-dependent hydrolase